MFENRIRDFFAVPTIPAFVACPAPLFATFTTAHQSFIAEVYRRARELTEAQLRTPRRVVPEFSRN